MPPTSSAFAGLRQGSLHSFAAVSQFLSEGAAHEDTRLLREHLATLSGQIEQATQARRSRHEPAAIERQLALLARSAHQHQLLLTGMGSAWHALYEFGAYQRALRELRGALERWRQALAARDAVAETERFGDFERLAWRTLGEALLVMDIYVHQGAGALPAHSTAPQPRGKRLLARLRRWLAGRGL
ncbi:hypothetical protein [Pulveribacter suum]|uniref:Uncharacterized protein n=1 Tax=Pulveribacter suum TaxID=2116657 RepID=A0A2P1NIT0_9BURK|nr:hypothetical protein [Pulveribacter suum]AVP56955.1 hypothetical protein C7H73_04255 [Pulveribacter suum]